MTIVHLHEAEHRAQVFPKSQPEPSADTLFARVAGLYLRCRTPVSELRWRSPKWAP